MLCYKDKTFCASETHKPDCDRILSREQEEDAKGLGLPVAYGNFCT